MVATLAAPEPKANTYNPPSLSERVPFDVEFKFQLPPPGHFLREHAIQLLPESAQEISFPSNASGPKWRVCNLAPLDVKVAALISDER